MDSFYNGKPEKFLLFVINFNMTLEASGTLKSDANIQYLCILVRREELYKFDTLCDKVGSATPENLTSIFVGLGAYFFPVNALPM